MSGGTPIQPRPHKCPTFFVPDFPSDRDSFETNKAYKRIVSAIVDVVKSSNSDGMSIGIEGSWGAGKTTIINLLRDELRNLDTNNEAKGQVHLIAFDAWAHEGDPLRLTFLETLKDGLVTKGWVVKHEWDEQLDIISGRKDITNTASDYGLTWFDYVIAFSFFLIPIGVAFLQAGLRNEITFDSSQPVAWKFLLGLFLCVAAPLLVLGKLWFRSARGAITDPQTTKQWFLALLLNRTLSAGRTVVIKTPEPTSTEFEKQFKNLMSDALDNHQGRRIILVIDNLDRVQQTQAIAIWSTLQTFLQHRYHNPPKWLRQLYTIVLFDPKRISEQPRQVDDKTNGLSYDLTWSPTSTQSGEEQSDGSFLDKSFQIRFEVPPPIVSDWRSYLLDLLSQALPQHASEHHDIYRVLAVERYRNPPTIRELKVYVNQISAIHLQWEDAFPLSHVAYYVRLKRRHEEIVSELVKGNYPEQAYKDILGDGARDSLAALSYNVEPQIAYQILLGNPIQEALTDSTGKKLNKLAANFKNGFWEAFESAVSSDWAAGQSERVGIAVVAIDQSGVLNNTSRAEADSVRRTLIKLALDSKSWKPFDLTIAEGVSIVCQWISLGSSNGNLLNCITQLFEAITEGLFEKDPMRKSVVAVLEWLKALQFLIQRNRSVNLPEVNHVNIILSKIHDRLKSRDYVQAEEISRLLEVLVELDFKEVIAGDTLRELADSGTILYYFNFVHTSSKAHDSCAWCILTFLCFATSVKAPPNGSAHEYNALLEISKKENVQDVQEFSKLLVRYKDTLTPIVMEREDVLKDFLSECLKHIAEGQLAASFFTTQFILKNWTLLAGKISDLKKDHLAFGRIVTLLGNNAELIEEIERTGFKNENTALYRLLIDARKSDTSSFRDWCRAYLERLTTTEWESDMKRSHDLIFLASALTNTGTLLNLGEQYQNAVLATVEHALTDTKRDYFLLIFDMGFLLGPLNDNERRSVTNEVYKRLQRANGKFPSGFFSSFGKLILDRLRLNEESLSSILGPIIKSRDETDLRWLIRVISEKSLLAKDQVNPKAWSNLKTMVREAQSYPPDPATPLIEALVHAIGIQELE